jgi:hypothetical protein
MAFFGNLLRICDAGSWTEEGTWSRRQWTTCCLAKRWNWQWDSRRNSPGSQPIPQQMHRLCSMSVTGNQRMRSMLKFGWSKERGSEYWPVGTKGRFLRRWAVLYLWTSTEISSERGESKVQHREVMDSSNRWGYVVWLKKRKETGQEGVIR